MPLEILEVHFDCAGSQNLVGRGGCLSRLRSRSHFGSSNMFDRMTMPCRTFLRCLDGVLDAFEQCRYPDVTLLRCGLDNFEVYRRFPNRQPYEHDRHHRHPGVVYYDCIAKEAMIAENLFDPIFIEEICATRTRASWNVDLRRSASISGERSGVTDDFNCPIHNDVLLEAVAIVSSRFASSKQIHFL